MHRCRVLWLAIYPLVLAGCLGEGPKSATSWLHPLQPAVNPDAVFIDVALVQIPFGEGGYYRDLWSFLDEHVVALEQKPVLEQNGFRVGQVGSNPPAELLDLLTNPRTSPNPRRIQTEAGKSERVIDLGPPLANLRFTLHQGNQAVPVELEQAQCALILKPSLAENNRTRLQIIPHVKHPGRSGGLMPWRPRADRSGWMLNIQQSGETYDSLGCEVILAPGEYLVIGAKEDCPETLGHRAFVRPEEPIPVQRLLVLRAWGSLAGGNSSGPASPAGQGNDWVPPLALQAAGWTSARGASR